MKDRHLIRTATVVSLAAAMIGAGWVALQGDELQVDPAAVPVASAQAETGYYFPAGFTLQPNSAEPEAYEFY